MHTSFSFYYQKHITIDIIIAISKRTFSCWSLPRYCLPMIQLNRVGRVYTDHNLIASKIEASFLSPRTCPTVQLVLAIYMVGIHKTQKHSSGIFPLQCIDDTNVAHPTSVCVPGLGEFCEAMGMTKSLCRIR